MTALSDAEILQLLADEFQMSARVRAQGEEVPRFRIFTPDGDYLILVQMLDDPADRERRLHLVAGFMAWKMASAFIVSGENTDPAGIFSLVSRPRALRARSRPSSGTPAASSSSGCPSP